MESQLRRKYSPCGILNDFGKLNETEISFHSVDNYTWKLERIDLKPNYIEQYLFSPV